jgi:hypothetical protein
VAGGADHGYFLPGEGVGDKALALFSFPGLASHEQYRKLFGRAPEFIAADAVPGHRAAARSGVSAHCGIRPRRSA